MSRGDRLGIVGLILACVGIGIAILWPTVRWIGWIAILAAIGLIVCWGVLELKRPKQLPSFIFVFGIPLGDNNSSAQRQAVNQLESQLFPSVPKFAEIGQRPN